MAMWQQTSDSANIEWELDIHCEIMVIMYTTSLPLLTCFDGVLTANLSQKKGLLTGNKTYKLKEESSTN